MSRAGFFCLVGLLLLANRGMAMQCYRCDSCGSEPFSTVGAATITCSSNLCYTSAATATAAGIATTIVSRGCAVNGTAIGCVSGGVGVIGLDSGSQFTCTCTGDKCNYVGISTTTVSRGCATAEASTGCASGDASPNSLVSGSVTMHICSGNISALIVTLVLSMPAALMFK